MSPLGFTDDEYSQWLKTLSRSGECRNFLLLRNPLFVEEMQSMRSVFARGNNEEDLKCLKETIIQMYPEAHNQVFDNLRSTKNIDINDIDLMHNFYVRWGVKPSYSRDGVFLHLSSHISPVVKSKLSVKNKEMKYIKNISIDLRANSDEIQKSVAAIVSSEKERIIGKLSGRPSGITFQAVDFYLSELIFKSSSKISYSCIEEAYLKTGIKTEDHSDTGRKRIKSLRKVIEPSK